jgi:hypothetical protein
MKTEVGAAGRTKIPLVLLDVLRERHGSSALEMYSALGPAMFLAVATGPADAIVPDLSLARVNAWLTVLPCPVIALTPGSDHTLPSLSCDLVVSSPAELAAVVERIRRAPLAAAVLVQTLRLTKLLPIAEALTVESLAYATVQSGPEFASWLARQKRPDRPQSEGLAVLIDRRDSRLDIRLNRPATRNALSIEMRDSLCEALRLAVDDDSIQNVTIAGEGRCFSVGGDLGEFGTAPDSATAHAVRMTQSPPRLIAECADRMEFRLHGACVGAGVELAAFGRRVLADRRTFFQLPELGFGLIPGAGGCVGIPRRIGLQRTAYLALSGKRVSAVTALRWGLIDALID